MASMWTCYYCQVANSERALTCKLRRGWWEEVWDQKGKRAKSEERKKRARSRNRQDKGKEDANYDPLRPFGIKGGKEAKEEEDNTKVMAQLETIRSALGDNPAEEVLAALESLDSSVRKDAGKPAVSEDQALSAAHLYRLLNAKKQMEKAKQKLMDLDTAWKSFQQMVTQRIKEQKDSYLAQRVEAVQDDIDDADLQATLQAATDGDPEFVDVEAMQDTAGQDAFTLNLKPFGRFKPNTTSPKRKIEETGKEAEKEEGPPKSKGPKK
ncbi:unnamed protein product [Durusdinium trenchii]|uniref:Uncharacterized protein n=1 Tax=Durusdinium trenchii TaxID=1381693 RepID=A0ABP0IIN9_9DINO